MKTEITIYLRNGESVLVEQEGEWTLKDLANLLGEKGTWLVFPAGKYHADHVFVRDNEVTHITMEVSEDYE